MKITHFYFRKSSDEKFLVVTKNRLDHHCEYQWMVMAIIKWEGIKEQTANYIYERVGKTLGSHGKSFQRRCEANAKKTCACQV